MAGGMPLAFTQEDFLVVIDGLFPVMYRVKKLNDLSFVHSVVTDCTVLKPLLLKFQDDISKNIDV